MKASQRAKELALGMRSRVASSKRTGNYETFEVEVETDEKELVTATVGYDHCGKGMAAIYEKPGMDGDRQAGVKIAALDCVNRVIEEREENPPKLVKEREGWNWRFTDPAGLYLSHTGNLTVAPEQVEAYRIGHICLVLPDTLPLDVARLEYVGKAFFGEPRVARGLASGTKWTGDSYKFAVYVYRPEFGSAHAVILRTDGSGSRFYFLDDTDSDELWRKLVEVTPEPMLWTLCNSITHTYHQGRTDEAGRWQKLFLAGRLKKRRRGGVARVEIISERTAAGG